MSLKERRAAALKEAKGIVDRAEAEDRDLTVKETETVQSRFSEIEGLDVKIERAEKSSALVAKLAGGGDDAPSGPPIGAYRYGGGSSWAKSVTSGLQAAGEAHGLKSLLSGQISTPPTVEVAELPKVPVRLLDLIPRQVLDENTFSYLRQTVRTNNAAPVADNATKPTSVYTFEEIEDRARVIAHLSEPFPIRYADDHASMLQVVEGQLQNGIFEAIENLIVNGTGVDEQWEGILNTTGVVSVPYSTDVVTTLRKSRTTLESAGVAVTAVAMNPADIEALDLLREDGTSGGFLLDSNAYQRIFGPGVHGVPSLAVPAGQALVGDWNTTRLRVRQAAHTLAATQSGDLFDKNQMKLRTEGRYGFQFLRPDSLAIVELSAA